MRDGVRRVAYLPPCIGATGRWSGRAVASRSSDSAETGVMNRFCGDGRYKPRFCRRYIGPIVRKRGLLYGFLSFCVGFFGGAMWGRLILLARGANATGKKFGLILLVSNMGEGLWICSLYDADVGANGPCQCRKKDLVLEA